MNKISSITCIVSLLVCVWCVAGCDKRPNRVYVDRGRDVRVVPVQSYRGPHNVVCPPAVHRLGPPIMAPRGPVVHPKPLVVVRPPVRRPPMQRGPDGRGGQHRFGGPKSNGNGPCPRSDGPKP